MNTVELDCYDKREHRHNTKETPQTQVLGRDGSDYYIQGDETSKTIPISYDTPGSGGCGAVVDGRTVALASETNASQCLDGNNSNSFSSSSSGRRIRSSSARFQLEGTTLWKQVVSGRLWPNSLSRATSLSSRLPSLSNFPPSSLSSSSPISPESSSVSANDARRGDNQNIGRMEVCENGCLGQYHVQGAATVSNHGSATTPLCESSRAKVHAATQMSTQMPTQTLAQLQTSTETNKQRHADAHEPAHPHTDTLSHTAQDNDFLRFPNMLELRSLDHDETDTKSKGIKLTQEDQIRQHCSFFYRAVDDDNQKYHHCHPRQHQHGVCISDSSVGTDSSLARNLKLSARLRYSNWSRKTDDSFQIGNPTDPADYYDHDDLLAPPCLAYYKARYQQLNQDVLATSKVKNSMNSSNFRNYHDLALQEEIDDTDRIQGSSLNNLPSVSLPPMVPTMTVPSSPMPTNFSRSSLLYKNKYDNRLLLRLPRDRVRLVMDPNLEPGILSVCYTTDTYPSNVGTPTCTNKNHTKSLEPLFYCLTVPPTLYQQVVSEISDEYSAQSSFFFTIKRICKDSHGESHARGDDRVDIRVAWTILFILFLFLLINTFIWHFD